MYRGKILGITLFILITSNFIIAQNAVVKGTVYDSGSKPIPLANIFVKAIPSLGTVTDTNGKFELQIPSNNTIEITVSFLGYEDYSFSVKLKAGEVYDKKSIRLKEAVNMLPGPVIIDDAERLKSITRIAIDEIKQVTPGGFEDILKLLPQVSSNNELSSQYNVRGGNFDENLVFVNDVEIYRPVLIRSGNQEGLSFINSDMISSVVFSAGGFESRYGDKMSSVLDVRYRKPLEFAGSVSASLLGANAHVEGTSKDHLFRYNMGLRYKTTRYLLSSMDMQGKYDPNYLDFQSYLTYDLNEKIEFSFLGNISNNKYKFVPKDMETVWGTLNDAIGITMYFDGQEIDQFTNATGAFTTLYRLNSNTNLKFILSGYVTNEQETFDILSQYYLNEVDARIGSNYLGDSVASIGVGTYLNHARNYLTGKVLSFKHVGDFRKKKHNVIWGVQYNYEVFDYDVHEWNMIDSAGYSLPRSEDNVFLYNVDISKFGIKTNRFNAFIQDSYDFKIKKADLLIGGGIRLNYWDFNNEFLISPRFNIGLKPGWKHNFVFRFSTGLYHQPPMLKEIRRLDGTLNEDIKAQSSFHVVLGSDYVFKMWNRPFKLVTEVFYKYLYNLNPYSVDNVRIKYYGENIAKGYAAGIEAKINGEFVEGTESWFSIALMQTQEEIDGAFHLTKNQFGTYDTVLYGYVPRPTDQRLNIGVYFQDYIPGKPTWQVHLSLLFGTSLPYSILNKDKYLSIGRLRPYRRVDLGISKRLMSSVDKPLPEGNIFRHFKEIWISLEVFNLLDIDNTISYTWVTSVQGDQYGVPNYLTGRRLNVKLLAKF